MREGRESQPRAVLRRRQRFDGRPASGCGRSRPACSSLLLDAYQRRDKVGLVTFRARRQARRRRRARRRPPASNAARPGWRRCRPAAARRSPPGLLRAARVLRVERLRDPQRRPLLVVVTDGRHTTGPDPRRDGAGCCAARGVASVVVDCETGPVRLGTGRRGSAARSAG